MLLKRLIAALAGLLIAVSAQAATLLPQGKTQFVGNDGTPLSGGLVYFYIPGTTTPKNTFQDAAGTILNTNPVVLDSGGRAIIYGSGAYQEAVFDNLGNVIWNAVTADTAAGGTSFGGTSTGSANAQIVAAGSFTSQPGQAITYLAGFTNSAALSLTPTGGSAIPVLKDLNTGPTALTGGETVIGNSITVVYDQTRGAFHLISLPPQNSTPGDFSVGGNLTVAGASTMAGVNVTTLSASGAIVGATTLGITGAATFGSLAVNNNGTIAGTLGVTGNETVGGTLGVTSNETVGGTLGVTGTSTFVTVNNTTMLTSGITRTGGTSNSAPYNVSGGIMVPFGVGIRAANTVSARCTVTSGTASIGNGFNCNQLTTSGGGVYSISFTTSLNSTDQQVSLTPSAGICASGGTKSTGSVGFTTYNCSSGTPTNFTGTVDVTVFGGN